MLFDIWTFGLFFMSNQLQKCYIYCCTRNQPVIGKTAKMFSLLLICMGIGFGKAQSEEQQERTTSPTLPTEPRLAAFPSCDKVIFYGRNGTISSPNYPNAYTDNLDCYSYISVVFGRTISIRFLTFSTQSINDWVTISCLVGNGFTSPRYSGSHINATLEMHVFSCSLVKVHFHTDSSINDTGFSLSYTTTSACQNVYFSGGYGTISSPNYPNVYTNNLDCYAFISVSSGRTISIRFSKFSTQWINDWVTISCESGNAFTSPRYSGLRIPPPLVISSCNLVKVHLHTDSSVNYNGFSLFYITSLAFYGVDYLHTACDDMHFSGPNGTISSPNYPNVYTNNLDCFSYISVTPGDTVSIRFLVFITEPVYDWVTISCSDGKDFETPRYSGSDIPAASVISSCSLVKVHFHTDSSDTYSGFNLSYTTTLTCGIRNFSGQNGQISSPNFPGLYENGLDCYTYVTVSSGETIIVTFLTLDTEESYDWVTIICESGNASRSTSHSGSHLPSVLTLSSCNRISVNFRSDYYSTNTKTGFSLTYNVTTDIFVGGIITRPSNAFPRTDKDANIIFNCTTRSKYSPWWTYSHKMTNRTITNSTCGVITSLDFILTEKSGPGSCNLIVTMTAYRYSSSTVSFLCTDATLSSARAILQQIHPELRSTRGNTSLEIGKDIIRDEAIRISCNPSFVYLNSRKSRYFTLSLLPFFLYNGGPVVQMRILRTYWTSEGIVVPSTDTSNTSSYVMVKAPKGGVIPPYTCNIVCDFFSNITDISDVIDVSVSTDPVEVLYWPTEENMTINGHDNGQIRTPAVLTCYAAANPPANYTWIDESNGQRTSGPILIINNGGEYTCNASNGISPYQQSKSVTLQVVRDETPQNMQVFILLGIAVVAIIILLAILLIRICRLQEVNPGADAGDVHRGNVCELQQRGEGGEGNIYESVLDNDSHVYESEYDKLDAMRRRLPAIPKIYDALVGGCDEHENGLGRVTDANESEYDKIDDSSQRLPCLSGIYDELEFDK